ncbi:MAG: TonB-dependent receptor, partial [Pseudanabaenaceae cyanobacterium]
GGSNSYFGKLVYRLDDRQTLKLTADILNRATNTFFAPPNFQPETGGATTITSLFSGLSANRSRVSLDYDFSNPEGGFRALRAQIYYQDTQTPETTLEERRIAPAGSPPGTPPSQLARRDGFNNFLDRIVGGSLQLSNAFTTGELNHILTYGVELSTQRNERPRQRVQTNLVTGAQTQNNIPENFPTKDFPDSDTLRVGVYVQNEIEWGDVSIIPGLRFDSYGLTTTADADFFRNSSPPPANFSTTSFSPRLAVIWKLSPEVRLFGQYARGFRAPLYDEINSGFANTLAGYFVAPNPDLKAETSDGFELGLRGNFPQGRFSIAAFYNHYSNFIERFANTGTQVLPGFPRPFLRFQSRNAASARIYGLEASGEYRFQPGTEGFRLLASLGFAVGDDLTADRPLSTINPFKAVAGLQYRGEGEKWGAELVGTFVGTPRAPADTRLLIPDGYVTVDLLGFVQFSPAVRLNVGLFNLFNTKYFEYADLRNVAAADRFRVDRFAQPGIHFQANLSWEF